jgi:hypothetical protein
MGIHVELKPALHPIRIVKLDEAYAPSSRAFAQLYPSYLLSTRLCMLVLAHGTSNEYSAQ